jgi:hypothetical protein
MCKIELVFPTLLLYKQNTSKKMDQQLCQDEIICDRCGREHDVSKCYAKTDVHGNHLSDDEYESQDEIICDRCGREHDVSKCYAKTDVHGDNLSDDESQEESHKHITIINNGAMVSNIKSIDSSKTQCQDDCDIVTNVPTMIGDITGDGTIVGDIIGDGTSIDHNKPKKCNPCNTIGKWIFGIIGVVIGTVFAGVILAIII